MNALCPLAWIRNCMRVLKMSVLTIWSSAGCYVQGSRTLWDNQISVALQDGRRDLRERACDHNGWLHREVKVFGFSASWGTRRRVLLASLHRITMTDHREYIQDCIRDTSCYSHWTCCASVSTHQLSPTKDQHELTTCFGPSPPIRLAYILSRINRFTSSTTNVGVNPTDTYDVVQVSKTFFIYEQMEYIIHTSGLV
jgi:hypothetical protein